MSNVKTAISLDEALFHEVEGLAQELKIPRSRVFALALEDFIRRRQNQRLLQENNTACEGLPEPGERNLVRGMRRRHWKIVEGEW